MTGYKTRKNPFSSIIIVNYYICKTHYMTTYILYFFVSSQLSWSQRRKKHLVSRYNLFSSYLTQKHECRVAQHLFGAGGSNLFQSLIPDSLDSLSETGFAQLTRPSLLHSIWTSGLGGREVWKHFIREYWMIYRGPDFLFVMIWLLAHTLPPPPAR